MNYVKIPRTITYNDIKEKTFLSPSCYSFILIKNKNTEPLLKLIENETPIKGEEVGSPAYVKHSDYFFMRTQAVSEDNFTLITDDSDCFVPITKTVFDEEDNIEKKSINIGDIFYVKGGNVGEVGIANSNALSLFSSHIFKFKIDPELRYYVFAILKSEFGWSQIINLPNGAIKGLDTFRTEYLNNIIIPFPNKNSEEIITYISIFVKAIIRKEEEIRDKMNLINNIIEKELSTNQKNTTFSYNLPTYNDLSNISRLDTGLYSEDYKKTLFLIENYKNGFSDLITLGFEPSRGQNLQISNIGKSIYSVNPKDNFYKLLFSSNITQFMTISNFVYLGNKNPLKTIRKGEIIFTCRGDMGKCIVFCEETLNTITNIDNLHLTNESNKLESNIFLGVFLNYLKKKGFIEKIAIGGSGADSFTKYQFSLLKIPSFSKKKQTEISRHYYNPTDYEMKNLNLNEFEKEDLKVSDNSGIIQLDRQIKLLKQKIDETINKIVNNENIEIDFKFLVE